MRSYRKWMENAQSGWNEKNDTAEPPPPSAPRRNRI
jgi:hypothetical protein